MNNKKLKLCIFLIGILFLASCQKDDSTANKTPLDETRTNAKRHDKDIPKIILPNEDPDAGTTPPRFYLGEIKGGVEIMTPFQQKPPSIPGGGSFPCELDILLGGPNPEVIYSYLYLMNGDTVSYTPNFPVEPIFIPNSTGLYQIWEDVHFRSNDFAYQIFNNGKRLRLTAKRPTTDEYNKATFAVYEKVMCPLPGQPPYTIYFLRVGYIFTFITYPWILQ